MTTAHHGIQQKVSARYWRLLAADTSWATTIGNYQQTIYEIYLYTSLDASGTRISVSSTTASTTYSGSYPGSNTQDGNTSTFWSTAWNQTSPQWISFDCSSAVIVKSIKLDTHCENPHGMFAPKKIAVQYSSDGSNWSSLLTVDVENSTIVHTIRTFTNLQV